MVRIKEEDFEEKNIAKRLKIANYNKPKNSGNLILKNEGKFKKGEKNCAKFS